MTESHTIPVQHLEAAAEEVVHVPWCTDVAYTLQLMRERFCSLASVVNEYGETVGIVTNEDIVDTMLMPQSSRAKRLLRREPVLKLLPGGITSKELPRCGTCAKGLTSNLNRLATVW